MTRYVVMGRYNGHTEELDSFDTMTEAELMRAEYCMAFGVGWSIWVEVK